jgi:hypothetical protein
MFEGLKIDFPAVVLVFGCVSLTATTAASALSIYLAINNTIRGAGSMGVTNAATAYSSSTISCTIKLAANSKIGFQYYSTYAGSFNIANYGMTMRVSAL